MLNRVIKLLIASVSIVSAEVEVTDGADLDLMLGLHPNEKYKPVDDTFQKHAYPYSDLYNLDKLLERQQVVEQPPDWMLHELMRDSVRDKWEGKPCKTNATEC